jgi:hypothetical protein
VGYSDTVKHWRLLMVAEAEAKMMTKALARHLLLRLGAGVLV